MAGVDDGAETNPISPYTAETTSHRRNVFYLFYIIYSVYIKYTLFIHLPSRYGRDGEWAAFLANDDDKLMTMTDDRGRIYTGCIDD